MDTALHAKIYRRAADVTETIDTESEIERRAYGHAAGVLRKIADDYAAVAEMNAPDYKRTIVASYEYE